MELPQRKLSIDGTTAKNLSIDGTTEKKTKY